MNARTARQWMVTHEWMIKPMAQEEWIEGKGLLVWLAEVFSALGTGLYLVATLLQPVIPQGRLLGRPPGLDRHRDLQAAPSLPVPGQALAFLEGFPARQQRLEDLLVRPRHRLHHDLPGIRCGISCCCRDSSPTDVTTGTGIEVANWVLMVLAGITCVITAIYCGFAMSYCKSVPFWNTGLLPFVFLLMGIADGLALIMAVGLVSATT